MNSDPYDIAPELRPTVLELARLVEIHGLWHVQGFLSQLRYIFVRNCLNRFKKHSKVAAHLGLRQSSIHHIVNYPASNFITKNWKRKKLYG